MDFNANPNRSTLNKLFHITTIQHDNNWKIANCKIEKHVFKQITQVDIYGFAILEVPGVFLCHLSKRTVVYSVQSNCQDGLSQVVTGLRNNEKISYVRRQNKHRTLF